MKILLINKFYYLKGGAEKHFLELKKILEDHGHKVVVFSMSDPNNINSPQAKYFVSKVDFDRVRFNWQGLRVAGRMLYSFEARRKISQLLDAEKPDLVHIHNIYHQISPSILTAIKKRSIPIVQTLHDYKLLSPNYALYCHGQICERCQGGKYYRCIAHRCIKNSYVASALSAFEMYVHKALKLYEKNVDVFVCPSKFMASQLLKWNIQAKRIEQIYNFSYFDVKSTEKLGEYLLFVGRLSEEKGVDALFESIKGTNIQLKIIGTGPEEKTLKEKVRYNKIDQVEFLGYKEGRNLQEYINNARALIVPSQWYENCPLVIIEAFQSGKPVLATRIGGIPELVADGKTGYTFALGDCNEMRRCINKLFSDDEKAREMGRNASDFARQFTPEQYYQKLMKVYESVLEK